MHVAQFPSSEKSWEVLQGILFNCGKLIEIFPVFLDYTAFSYFEITYH